MKRQIVLFSLVYFPITVFTGLLWIGIPELKSIVFFALWQLVMAKAIYDVIWMITAWLSKDDIPQQLSTLSITPPVALLYTCRDDILDVSMKRLVDQDYPNYDIYILDDSKKAQSKKQVDQCVRNLNVQDSNKRIFILRRNSIEGYKAGNLNNWLFRFGDQYKYFVIFDNDSLAEEDFITKLVRYAEHPANESVAIFQSLILPWNNENYFVRWIGATAPISMLIFKRNSNRTGTAISFGHNNLHKTFAFQELEGFNQELTSEDTVATFELDMAGYKTKMVDVVSYESEPADILKYTRRAVRWAGQTMALFTHPWEKVSGALKVELSRLMLYYFINVIFLFWILGSIWYFDENLTLGDQWRQIAALRLDYDTVYFVSFVLILFVLLLNFSLHFSLATKCEIPMYHYFGHLLLSTAVFFFTMVPVTMAILKSIIGNKVKHDPSNIESGTVSLWGLIKSMKVVWLGSLAALSLYVFNHQAPWSYMGGVWALLIFLTPVFLVYVHKYTVSGEDHGYYNKNNTQINQENSLV